DRDHHRREREDHDECLRPDPERAHADHRVRAPRRLRL
ncbi:MAG: hypothetical protein AVDCRST_MAG53-330, partial [uncultured Solirubrobacteraceae bacterium]